MDIISVKVINGNIQCLNSLITRGRPKTYLNASFNSGVGAITVFQIEGFTVGNYYALIGEIGSGNAEIVKMHASTAPTGNTLTLAANTAKAHDYNEPVYFIAYNQVEFNSATTPTGSKTVLATNAIDPTRIYTPYATSSSTGYAFCRFKGSDAGTFSSYSHAAPFANPAYNTVEYIINEAIDEAGYKEQTNQEMVEYLLKQINECLRDIRRNRAKFSWTQSFRYTLGQTSRGQFQYSLPSDIYDKYSKKAIDAVRIKGESHLYWVDPNYFFDYLMNQIVFTNVSSQASVGDTTLYIDNSYDFDDSGSVLINGQTITYTGITRSTTAGELTGVPATGTGSITATIAADSFVFQNNISEGEPSNYTLMNGYLYIWPLPDTTWVDMNVKLDYFKTVTSVDSLDDTIDYIQFDAIKSWLKWKLRTKYKNDGIDDLKDTSFLLYKEQITMFVKSDRSLNESCFRNAYEDRDINNLYDDPRQWRGEVPR